MNIPNLNKTGSYEALARGLQYAAPTRIEVQSSPVKATFFNEGGRKSLMTNLDGDVWEQEEILVPEEVQSALEDFLDEDEAQKIGLVFDWAPKVREGPIEVFRVTGGPVFGREEGAASGVFATSSGEAVEHMVRWNDQRAIDLYGGHGAYQEIKVVRAQRYHLPLPPEKDNHVDATDGGEVVVDEGEIIDTLPADDFR